MENFQLNPELETMLFQITYMGLGIAIKERSMIALTEYCRLRVLIQSQSIWPDEMEEALESMSIVILHQFYCEDIEGFEWVKSLYSKIGLEDVIQKFYEFVKIKNHL